MSYDATLTITIPASLYDVACAIARSLDPDLGGADSFGPRSRLDADGNEYTPESYSTTTPCTSAFRQQATAMLSDPAMLHAAVSADYATRWADLTPPTQAECQEFCAGVQIGGQDVG